MKKYKDGQYVCTNPTKTLSRGVSYYCVSRRISVRWGNDYMVFQVRNNSGALVLVSPDRFRKV